MTERLSLELDQLTDFGLLTPVNATSLYRRAMEEGVPYVAYQTAEWLINNNGLGAEQKEFWQDRSKEAFEKFVSQAADPFIKNW